MKFFQVIVLSMILMVVANGEKVSWGPDGKAHIEKSDKIREGCSQGGLKMLTEEENNSSVSCG